MAAAALLVGLLGGPAQAQLFSDDDARRAILDLRSRVDQMQRDLGRRVDELSARVDRLEQTTRGQLELQNQIQAMRQEIASLRGALEVQTNELAKTQRGQRDLSGDVEARLRKLEPVTINLEGRPITVEPGERRLYDAALNAFRAGEFKTALAGFGQLQAVYPQSAYGPMLSFWSGSSQYALRDYKTAIAQLQSFVKAAPDHPRVPDALVIIGSAQTDLGDRKAATETYKSVIERHEGTPAAQAAKDRLAALNSAAAKRPTPAAPAAPR